MSNKPEKNDCWQDNRIKKAEVEKYMAQGHDFVHDEDILQKLSACKKPDSHRIKDILAKSLAIQSLSLDETAALLNVTDHRLLEDMKEAALKIKKKVYDNRIVTFAPLYMGNYCVNNCLYCGFKTDNKQAKRKVLFQEEIIKEVEVLAGEIGHKRLIVVYGEHPQNDVDYILSSIKTIYGVKVKVKNAIGNIRRINVNAPALSIKDLKWLHEAGIGTYQVFQETYHHQTYAAMHPKETIKNNYQWRLYCMHRAFEAGIDDVGIGALFGLYDWKFEVMGLVAHALELEKTFGIGPHTVSFPRLESALNIPKELLSRYKVSDDDFMKVILAVRLSIPYTGMIITARETASIRRAAISLGITQTDASTKIGIGGYSRGKEAQDEQSQQFILGDMRSLDEIVCEFAQMGYITSFCTAGYRCGRTGKCIMDLLRSGAEGKFCKLNAILTFKEWLDDFASENTKKQSKALLEREIIEVRKKAPDIFPKFQEYYKRIKAGERDLYI
ncbi:MAG: [FeFe] hydrogenase H-cluster radical SAM maturase HydG [Candidatus Omnitrophica bacterium]|nr:[FeFe] hydrogenase H-cluster radical SAM maturase HydG [Candidatus Omnitrophota bacterium]MBU4478587.1 [FeFe] hydrogenase H-cluster radical SAM maturase HydG [Candidatus Omnitrophota bacterium]